MLKALLIIILLGVSCSSRKLLNECYSNKNINVSEIVGSWKFEHSCSVEDVKLDLNGKWPISKMEFLKFKWSSLSNRYVEIIDSRKSNNLLSNIILRTYSNNDSLIDEFIPVAEKFTDGLSITIYGIKTKNELLIFQVEKGKMILTDGKVWKIAGKEYKNVVHHFTK